jgi:carboxyl-terminal processing protease
MVYDAGGITPDVALPRAKYSPLLQALMEKEVIHDYASRYHAAHAAPDSAGWFALSDADYEDFIAYSKTLNFTYQSVEEQRFNDFEKAVMAKRDTLFPMNLLSDIKDALHKQKSDEFVQRRTEIQPYIEQEIVSRYAYQWGRVQTALRTDEEAAQAAKLLADTAAYHKQLIVSN